MRNDFGVIIISHGRPECETVKTLRECGYTGEIFIVVDDEDKTLEQYLGIYGHENVHIFHKYEWFDVGDNLDAPRTVGVFARNECLKVAREKGLKYYLEMDDDLKALNFRYEKDGHLKGRKIRNFDKVIDAICEYFDNSDISCLGFGNAADYIGGLQNFNKVDRVMFNSFFMRTDTAIMWLGRHSDDTITQITQQKAGFPWIKLNDIQADYDVWIPKNKSKKAGGSISIYEELGAYVLRYYLVIFHPDCCKVKMSTNNIDNYKNINTAFPRIVSGRLRKDE